VAQVRLELGDAVGEGRLSDGATRRGGNEGALLGKRANIPKLLKIHSKAPDNGTVDYAMIYIKLDLENLY
jgi:hypothetical protein